MVAILKIGLIATTHPCNGLVIKTGDGSRNGQSAATILNTVCFI